MKPAQCGAYRGVSLDNLPRPGTQCSLRLVEADERFQVARVEGERRTDDRGPQGVRAAMKVDSFAGCADCGSRILASSTD